MTDEQIEQIARDHGTGGWQSLEDMKRFARAIEQASRRAALEEAAVTALAKLKDLTCEMEGYSYFGSNPGVKEDDYEDVADAIRALSQQPAKGE